MDNLTISSHSKKEGFDGQRACILPQSMRNFSNKHVFCRNLHITDIGYYPHAGYHNRERKHGCRQFILIYCVKGSGWYMIDNHRYDVQANQFFVLPKNQYHQYAADIKKPWSIYWIHFTGNDASFFYDYLDPQKNGPINTPPSSRRLVTFEDMIDHLELMNNEDNLIYSNSQLYAFLSSFKDSNIRKVRSENRPVQESIEFMKVNLHRHFTLAELAENAHLSIAHYCALFKEKTMYSPLNLFTSLKIQKACHFLQDSDYNIKTIASELGYIDQYHFSRVFKKVMGVSPKGFRKKDG